MVFLMSLAREMTVSMCIISLHGSSFDLNKCIEFICVSSGQVYRSTSLSGGFISKYISKYILFYILGKSKQSRNAFEKRTREDLY